METKIKSRIMNLHHLFWNFIIQIFKRWWLMLLVIAMVTAAGRGYAVMENKKEAVGGNRAEKVQGSTITAGITEVEFAHVYNAANIYDKIEQQRENIGNSRWFLYDDMKKVVLTAVCCVETNVENLGSQPVWICLNQFESSKLYETVGQKIGEETKAQFLKENVGYGYKDADNFYIQITSYDSESAEKIETAILEYLQGQMDVMEEELQAKCNIKVLSEECIDYVDTAIGDNKANLRNTLASLQTALNDTLAAMTNTEKGYYQVYLTAREEEGYIPGQELTFFVEEEIDPTVLAQQANQTAKKELTPEELAQRRLRIDTLIGFILGLGACIGAILIRYCWASKLVNGEEIGRMYDIAMLGTVTKTEKKQGRIEKKLRAKQRRSTQEADIWQIASQATARLRLQFDKEDKIYISGTQVEEGMAPLIEEGKKQGIGFVPGENILGFSPKVAEVNHVAAVLLIEKEGVSTYRDIDKEIQVLREAGKKICGMVILS